MRLIVGTLAVLGFLAASPAAAQAQGAITVGMQVTDSSGAPVGTVKAIQGTNVLIHTDRHDALLPRTSFTPANGKLLFGMTQGQLDAEIDKNVAASNAAIAAGATVKGSAGAQVGTIESVADGKVTIALQDGKKIAVPQEGLRGNADGTVTIGFSAAQLQALVENSNASGPAPSPDSSGH